MMMKLWGWALGFLMMSSGLVWAEDWEDRYLHIHQLAEEAMACVVNEANEYEYSKTDLGKTQDEFTEDYIDHIDEICHETYEALEAALEDSRLSEEAQYMMQTTLEQMHEVVVMSNAARYWDFFQAEYSR